MGLRQNPAAEPIKRHHLAGLDVAEQAKGLLGAELHTSIDGVTTSALIVETEAYCGRDDRASHAYPLKRTKRTKVFFGPPGHAYVYLCYGIHRMFNIIVGPQEEPNAILVRAVEPLSGIDTMLARRKLTTVQRRVSGGPGLVCRAMGIALWHNALDLFDSNSDVQLSGLYASVDDSNIKISPRVGVAYAGEDAARPWRFRVKDSDFTSPAK